MTTPLLMPSANPISVRVLAHVREMRDRLSYGVVLAVMVALTPLLILGGSAVGFMAVLGVLIGVGLAVLTLRWPVVGFYTITSCVVLVEQAPLPYPIITDRLNIFYWPPRYDGLAERPIGFFLLGLIVLFLVYRLAQRRGALEGGALLVPFLFFLLCVAAGVVHGLATGGNGKIIVVEVRPFWYLFVTYLLAYNLISHRRQVRAFLWIVIVAAGIKGLQGVYVYAIVLHGNLDGQNEIMS